MNYELVAALARASGEAMVKEAMSRWRQPGNLEAVANRLLAKGVPNPTARAGITSGLKRVQQEGSNLSQDPWRSGGRASAATDTLRRDVGYTLGASSGLLASQAHRASHPKLLHALISLRGSPHIRPHSPRGTYGSEHFTHPGSRVGLAANKQQYAQAAQQRQFRRDVRPDTAALRDISKDIAAERSSGGMAPSLLSDRQGMIEAIRARRRAYPLLT